MNDEDLIYKEYLPTDKWSLQDWFLHHLSKVGVVLQQLETSYYRGGIDRRALTVLFGHISAYHRQIEHLFEKFLLEKDYERLKVILSVEPDRVTIEMARELVSIVSDFHNRSGLFKIIESKPLGPFGNIRMKRGMGSQGGGD